MVNKFVEVPLSELFDFPSIRGLTQEFIMKNPGTIPVYGGRKVETPIGYIKDGLKNVKYFQNCLGWNREGSVGYVFWHKNKFTTNDHHRPMILKEKYVSTIYLGYMQIVIEKKLLSLGFEWSKTAGKEAVKNIEVSIPIDNNGNFDFNKQIQVYEEYNRIKLLQNKLKDYQITLKNSNVIFEENYDKKTISLSDSNIFSLCIGDRVLKKNIKKQGIPVYSSNVYVPFGYLDYTILTDFSKPSLIWGIDGTFDWNYLPAGYKFTPTDHCGVLRLNTEDILPEYLLYVLKKDKDSYGFDRTFRASLQNIKEYVKVDIPIDKHGNFDRKKQEEIVRRVKKINKIKKYLISNLSKLSDSIIDIDIFSNDYESFANFVR